GSKEDHGRSPQPRLLRARIARHSRRTSSTETDLLRVEQRVEGIREIIVAATISSLFVGLFALAASSFRTRAALQAEILALRHQLAPFQNNAPRHLILDRRDRLLRVLLYRFWSGW